MLKLLGEAEFPPGAVVIKQGGEQHSLYVIKSGSARVLQAGGKANGGRDLAILEAGAVFGERALIKHEKAAATVEAIGDANKAPLQCYVLAEADFSALASPLTTLIETVMRRRESKLLAMGKSGGSLGRAGSNGSNGAGGSSPGGGDGAAAAEAGIAWGDLELRRILGVGTLGRVKLVVHKPTGKPYALKCMRKAQVVECNLVRHVMSEKRILAGMDHPFILPLVGAFQDAGEV